MTPPIIALSGYAGCGKDAVGGILVERHGYERRGFADKVKALAFDLGWNGEKDDAGRRFLQILGEQARNHLGADVWIRAALADPPPFLVVTDCRYPNEFVAIKALGGQVWRVERPGVGPANDHISETALDRYRFDAVIPNDADLQQLSRTVATQIGASRVHSQGHTPTRSPGIEAAARFPVSDLRRALPA